MRSLAVIAFAAILHAPAAHAQKGDPGTRLILESDTGPATLVLHGVGEEPEEPGEGVSVGVRGRWVTIPDAVFDPFLLDHTSFDSYSLGLEVGIDGPAKSRVVFGIDYTDLGMPPGNWRQDNKRPNQASYTTVDLHMVALDATFLWRLKFVEQFGMVYGVGLGVAFTPGTITQVDVLPTCTHPVSECQHWNQVTEREQEIPSRVWPLLNLQLGFYFDPTPGLRIRLETGFRGVIFAGLATRMAF